MHKIAFEAGGLVVHWYGVLVALGFLAGIWTASRRGLLLGVHPDKVVDLGPWLMLGAIVGARTLYVISYWKESFANQPLSEIFMVQHGGLVFYGGLIGASLACIIYARIKQIPLWKFADVLAPSIALGHVFGRMGCLMNGCCYGYATNVPWAIHFPVEHETHGVGVHPTEIYESFLNFALYLSLAWLFRRRKFEGQVFSMYLICYAILRSFVEVYRGDYPKHYLGGVVTPGQLVSVGIFVTGAVLYWILSHARPLAAAPSISAKGVNPGSVKSSTPSP